MQQGIANTTLPLPSVPPVATHEGHVPVSGARIYYAEYGAGVPIILLHGGLGQGGHWAFQIPALAERHRVITIDSRGHGRSTRGSGPMSYRRMADDVLAVMDQLKIERAAIVGWSDGGIIGLELAIRQPQRLCALLAFGANYRSDGIVIDVADDPFGKAYAAVASRDYRTLSSEPQRFDEFVQVLQEMWRSQPNFSESQLRSIRVPTVIAAGYHEEYVKFDHTVALARLIPDAELAILPGVGHFGVWQRPQDISQLVLEMLGRAVCR